METAENLSQTSKRTVGRRKAAEKSEKKWKDAMEEDQTFEALPDVFLGTCLGIPEIPKEPSDTSGREPQISAPIHTQSPPVSSSAVFTPASAMAVPPTLGIPATPILPSTTGPSSSVAVAPTPAVVSPSTQTASVAPTPLEIPKINKSHIHHNVTSYKGNINMSKSNGLDHSFTILEDSILKDVVDHLACVNCCTKSLTTILSKNNKGRTEEIRVSCTNCKKIIFQRLIPQVLPKAYSKRFHGSSHADPDSLKRKAGDADSSNVELLVCDVDVMKEDQSKEAEQDTFVSSPKNGGCNDSQRRKRKRTIISRVKKKERIKPIRPCFFCSKMQSRLSRHVKTTHANQPYVQNMLRQPKEIQAKMMRQLRSEGIFAENQRRIKAGRYDLLRIRNQGSGELSACSYCRGYYKKKLLWRHRTTCIARPNNATQGQSNLLLPSHTQNKNKGSESLNGIEDDHEDDNNLSDSDGDEPYEDMTGDKNINSDSSSDPPEINRIREILDGLEHGIFSQSGNPGHEVNGFFIKQEREEYIEDINIPSGNSDYSASSNHMGSITMDDITSLPRNKESETINEDQLLFDSLPAILSNSNLSSYGNPPLQAHYDPVKMKKNDYWNHNDTYSDENYYYMWQDVNQLEAQHQDLVPCNTLYTPNKKRKPRSEFQYQFWKKEDEDTILHYFTDMIKAMKVPGKDACREFLSKNPDIKTDWTRVKYKVYNQIQKQKKKMKKE